MCLYFLLQLGSGHSISCGDAGCSGPGLLAPFVAPREEARDRFQFFVSGVSGSRALRLVPPGSDLTGLGGGLKVGVTFPLRPLTAGVVLVLALRSLPLRVSATLRSLVGAPAVVVAARPLLPRPLGVRDSISLVGESQNLAGREGREASQLTQ